MKKEAIKKLIAGIAIVLFFGAFLGTLTHELIGHGLTIILFGGKITNICVLFLEMGSDGFSFTSCVSAYSFWGWISWQFEKSTPISYGFSTIMGPLSTFLISIIFSFIVLFKRKFTGYSKYILTVFSLYFIDILYNFSKFYFDIGDFSNILNRLGVSVIPLLPITLIGMLTTSTILFYKWKGKEINKNLQLAFFLLLSLVLIFLIIYIIYFGLEIKGSGFVS